MVFAQRTSQMSTIGLKMSMSFVSTSIIPTTIFNPIENRYNNMSQEYDDEVPELESIYLDVLSETSRNTNRSISY